MYMVLTRDSVLLLQVVDSEESCTRLTMGLRMLFKLCHLYSLIGVIKRPFVMLVTWHGDTYCNI